MNKLYIAYGSNLNLSQMAARCPSATIYSTGLLNNWELIFRGSPTNSHATIRKCMGKTVPVLVWNIKPIDEKRLDIYEEYPVYYFKRDIMVNIDGKKKKAMVYVMNESQQPGRPSHQYVQTILQGYRDNNFNIETLTSALEINSIECKQIL